MPFFFFQISYSYKEIFIYVSILPSFSKNQQAGVKNLLETLEKKEKNPLFYGAHTILLMSTTNK